MTKICMKRGLPLFDVRISTSMLSNALYLKELKNTFDDIGIPPAYYSLNGYGEDAVCIEGNDDSWLVYNGERGNKYNINKYKNIQDACSNLILRLSESEEEREQIQNIFENSLKKHRYAHAVVSSRAAMDVIVLADSNVPDISSKLIRKTKKTKKRRSFFSFLKEKMWNIFEGENL